MTRLLIDTSVVIKWFHSAGESGVVEARSIRDLHVEGSLDAHVLDLAVYEMGNVLSRSLKWPAADVTAQLDDLLTILGPPLAMSRKWFPDVPRLAEEHQLTFYDASWAAAAAALEIPLVSADRRLVAAGLALTAADMVGHLAPGRGARASLPR